MLFETLVLIIFFLVQGFFDLFRLPLQQYNKDGRIMRGFQLGAQSFSARTAFAALEITSRIIHLLQVLKKIKIYIYMDKFSYHVIFNFNLSVSAQLLSPIIFIVFVLNSLQLKLHLIYCLWGHL